jgi:hypothetical protein
MTKNATRLKSAAESSGVFYSLELFSKAGRYMVSADGGYNLLDFITKCRTLCRLWNAFGECVSIEG